MVYDRAAVFGQRYQMLGALGKGGMGSVYRVQDRLLNRQVALKRVELPAAKGSAPPSVADSRSAVVPTLADIAALPTEQSRPEPGIAAASSAVVVVAQLAISRERLLGLRLALANEFRTLSSLRHPNIVSVLDYGFSADGQPFFTMELLLDGQGLCDAGESCSLPVKASLLLQILQALSYLHRRGVLHRDLKPANIISVEKSSPSFPRSSIVLGTHTEWTVHLFEKRALVFHARWRGSERAAASLARLEGNVFHEGIHSGLRLAVDLAQERPLLDERRVELAEAGLSVGAAQHLDAAAQVAAELRGGVGKPGRKSDGRSRRRRDRNRGQEQGLGRRSSESV